MRLTLPPLGFGGSAIGGAHRPVSDADAGATVEAAWALGTRYFDTAPFYGAGLGERRLGEALATRPRADFAVSTKVGRLVVDGAIELDYSRDGVLRSLEASRRRTGLDRFEIVLVHDPEEHLRQTLDEALPALRELRDEGVLDAFGVGTNVAATAETLLREGELDVVMLAGRWTLVDRAGGELLDACAARSVPVLAAAPFNSGLLAEPEPRVDARFDYRAAPPERIAQARAAARICAAHGVELPAAALQFPLRHPAVTTVVAGVGDAGEARAAWQRLRAAIPEDAWRELDALGA